MKILKWLAGTAGAVVLAVLALDTFGGMLFDGPLGPIPGGAFNGAVNPDPDPQWADLPEVIELEIRPARPWSLSVWNVVLDGELYVPSAMGEKRRWTAVALEDPRVRVRANGQIYERRIVRVTDPALAGRIGAAVAARYGFEAPENPEDDSTWFFHIAPRSQP